MQQLKSERHRVWHGDAPRSPARSTETATTRPRFGTCGRDSARPVPVCPGQLVSPPSKYSALLAGLHTRTLAPHPPARYCKCNRAKDLNYGNYNSTAHILIEYCVTVRHIHSIGITIEGGGGPNPYALERRPQ